MFSYLRKARPVCSDSSRLSALLVAAIALAASPTGHASPVAQLPTVEFTKAKSVADEGTSAVRIRLKLSAIQGSDVLVPFVATGTAVDPADYSPGPNPVVIHAGNRHADLVILPADDALVEFPETIILTLLPPSGATLGTNGVHTLTLTDNDGVRGNGRVRTLELSPWGFDFSPQRVGDAPQVQSFQLTNTQAIPITFSGLRFEGVGGDDFQVSYGDVLPHILAPGASTSLQVSFDPLDKDYTEVSARIRQNPGDRQLPKPLFRGVALGQPTADVLINANDQAYVALDAQRWCADYGLVGTSNPVTSNSNIKGTQDDELYRTARSGASFGYSLPLPDGTYDVVLHAAELTYTGPGQRVFDVAMEGTPQLLGIDLVALKGFERAWSSDPRRVVVSGGSLELDFTATVAEALVAAIEVRSMALVDDDATLLDFGAVDVGSAVQLTLLLTNSGLAPAKVQQLDFVIDGSGYGSGRDFLARVNSVNYWGGDTTTSHSVDWDIPAGQSLAIPVFFQPTYHDDHFLRMELSGPYGMVQTDLKGTGGDSDWGFMHPVIRTDRSIYVDFDGDGVDTVGLIGSDSHTHEPGQTLAAYEWMIDGAIVSTDVDTVQSVPVGNHQVTLTIWDDKNPPDQASDSVPLDVHPLSAVPGILAAYHDGTGSGAGALLDVALGAPTFVERRADHNVDQSGGSVAGSGLSTEILVRAQSDFVLGAAAQLQFSPLGGYDNRVLVDGSLVGGLLNLAAGSHSLEVRWAVADLTQVPLGLDVFVDGALDPSFDSGLTHDEGGVVPTLHAMTPTGAESGGNLITLVGFGYFPPDQTVVHWGGIKDFALADLVSWEDGKLELTSPPGTGQVLVTVETPGGVSNSMPFDYLPDGPVPIVFTPLTDRDVALTGPTCAVFHPNGNLYVGLLDGRIAELSFDEDWYLQGAGIVLHPGVSGLTNFDLCGITVNPYDDPAGPVKLYVGHGEHWLNGGGAFSGPSPFTGEVSVLTGPTFDSPVPLVTGLPVSNHDHGINGLVFDNNGDLLVCVGGNTNAGVKHPNIGDLDESPLSGSIIKALTSKPGFNGVVTYVDRATGNPVTDQVFGESSDVAPGVDVFSYAHGLRNGFDLALMTHGPIYATDNGPNFGYGYESTGATTDSGQHGFADDELLWIEEDSYYGHPNRSRGFADPRQYIYQGENLPSDEDFTQYMIKLSASVNGLREYRSTTFNSQLRGWLVAQKWNTGQMLIELDSDGQSVQSTQWISPATGGLTLAMGPGGTIVSVDYSLNRLRFLQPSDAAATGLTAYEISPWRAPSTGGTPFVIGGSGFVSGSTTVTIDGVPAAITLVTPQRIHGILPPLPPNNVDGLYDVVVREGLNASIMSEAFLSLPAQAGNMPGYWETGPSAPSSLGEVSCAVVGTELFLFGEGGAQTEVYDLTSRQWLPSRAARPFPGHHHAAEVWQDKILLFGGLGSGSPGKVQIYDTTTDSWSTGSDMPWAGGSCSSASINGLVYVCGGIVGSSTVGNLSVYDPVGDTWDAGGQSLPDMARPCNHAASATDGTYLWVFGGRGGGNWPQPGYDTVQRYDPITQAWVASNDPGTPLAAMPLPRGGVGRAVFLSGEFLILGGEESGIVYDDVQAYDPSLDSWRMESPMPTARHGIFPVRFRSRMFVVGGGTASGFSLSDIVEIFRAN